MSRKKHETSFQSTAEELQNAGKFDSTIAGHELHNLMDRLIWFDHEKFKSLDFVEEDGKAVVYLVN